MQQQNHRKFFIDSNKPGQYVRTILKNVKTNTKIKLTGKYRSNISFNIALYDST